MKNIILISIDDLRFDALSCNGDRTYLAKWGLEGLPHTPNIDRFANEGIRFNQAISVGSYTPSTHASMFTGLYPPKHGLRAFMRNPLPKSIPTLAEILRDNGYTTISKIDFKEMFDVLGLNKGFEHRFGVNDNELLQHLHTTSDKLFLFIHFGDVHPPYGYSPCPLDDYFNYDVYKELQELAEQFGIKLEYGKPFDETIVDWSNKVRVHCEKEGIITKVQFPRYLRGVNKFDNGRFRFMMGNLERMGLLEDSMVVITSDHGQAPIAKERMSKSRVDKFDHGECLLEELIRIPLIMWYPRMIPASVGKKQVSQIDIMPAILVEAGIEFDSGWCDQAYSEVWWHDRGELSKYLKECREVGKLIGDSPDTFLYQKCVRWGNYKLIKGNDHMELYDLEDDPFEQHNLLKQRTGKYLASRLNGYMDEIEGDVTDKTAQEISNIKRRVRSLK